MKMAKASEADLNMAMELVGALDLCGQRFLPCMPEAIEVLGEDDESEPFDRDDDAQCGRVMRYLLGLADRASLSRVIYGAGVMLDPKNKLVDPSADTIEHHPEALANSEDAARYRWLRDEEHDWVDAKIVCLYPGLKYGREAGEELDSIIDKELVPKSCDLNASGLGTKPAADIKCMTTEDLDELAFLHGPDCPSSQARAVAKAVYEKAVAAERERCAALCRDIYRWRGTYSAGPMCSRTTETCAKAIESGA